MFDPLSFRECVKAPMCPSLLLSVVLRNRRDHPISQMRKLRLGRMKGLPYGRRCQQQDLGTESSDFISLFLLQRVWALGSDPWGTQFTDHRHVAS